MPNEFERVEPVTTYQRVSYQAVIPVNSLIGSELHPGADHESIYSRFPIKLVSASQEDLAVFLEGNGYGSIVIDRVVVDANVDQIWEAAKRYAWENHQTNGEPSKIHAIKRVRELTGWGLKESKEFVDARWYLLNDN